MATIPRQRRGQLSLLLAVGIAGVAVGFGLLYGAYRVGKKEGAERAPRITISNDVIVNQMRQVSQLVATKAYLTDIIEYNDTRNVLLGILKGRKKILVVARGHLNLGVDLSRVSPAIDSTRGTVSVDVPHATMLDPVLDTALRYYDVKRSIFNRFTEHDAANIQCSVDSAFRVAGRDMRVLQRADSDVKQALTSLLQGYGYTAIINFLPAPTTAAGRAAGQPADTASSQPAARDAPPAKCEFIGAPPRS